MPVPYVSFLSSSNTYLNYQRPKGYIDVFASSIVSGQKPYELLQRFLSKNLNVYLDFEPHRGQWELRKLLLEKQGSDDSVGEVDNLQCTLFFADMPKSYLIETGIHPFTHEGIIELVDRYEGEELLTGLGLLTPKAESLRKEFSGNTGQIFVRLDNPLFTGHPWFHPRDVVKIHDLEEAMRNPSPDLSSEIERVWISRTETEIFRPQAFPFEFISDKKSHLLIQIKSKDYNRSAMNGQLNSENSASQ